MIKNHQAKIDPKCNAQTYGSSQGAGVQFCGGKSPKHRTADPDPLLFEDRALCLATVHPVISLENLDRVLFTNSFIESLQG